MNLDEIDKKCFILALFIRDDGQRFLLGSGAYEFKDSQLHFSANTMSNDVVEVQGNDGYLLAGQVRRPTTQVFDGYIGDASINKSDIEGYRRDFFAFFQKNHFYTVVYIFPDGTSIQRRRGFIVDAGEIRELYQMFPEYHIGLNFEDVNYYKYAEDEDGHEQYAKSIDINISKAVSGGLIWDEVSQTQAYNHGTDFSISGTIEDEPVDYIDLYGDTQQTTYSGKNKYNATKVSSTSNTVTSSADTGQLYVNGTTTTDFGIEFGYTSLPAGTYTLCLELVSGSITTTSTGGLFNFRGDNITLVSCPISNSTKKNSVQVTVSANTTNARIQLWCRTSETFSNAVVKYQLVSGSTADYNFEPYVGGTASPNPDYPQEVQTVTGEQTVTVASKNILANIANLNATDNGITNTLNVDGSITCSGTVGNGWNGWNISGYIANSIPAGTYTFSIDQAISYDINVSFRDSANNTLDTAHITAGQTSTTVTISGQTARTSLWVAATTGTQINFTISAMLEKGSLATSFVPYATQTYPINLGKNLFDKDNANIISAYIESAGSHGIVNDNASTCIWIPCETNTTYTISRTAGNVFRAVTTSSTPTTGLTTSNYVGNDSGTSITVSTGANGKYIVAEVRNFSSSSSLNDILATIQIEKGSTATTYAPYVTAFGKNLFDKDNFPSVDGFIRADNYTLTSSASNKTTYIKVNPNTKYTFSGFVLGVALVVGTFNKVPALGDVANARVLKGASATTVTITTGASDSYIAFMYKTSSDTLDTSAFQIEKGSTATTYEPNMSGQLELCKIGTYQDYIYSVNGDYFLHKETGKSVMGSLTWNPASTGTSGVYRMYSDGITGTVLIPSTGSEIAKIVCSHYTPETAANTWSTMIGVAVQTTDGRLFVYDSNYNTNTSQSAFTAWLTNNNAVLYYALATPTDTQITDAALIAQLEALNSATTYAGVTWFKTESEYLPADTWAYVQIQAGGGVVWDNYGATWEEGGGGMIVNVNVDSIENVYPVWTVNGPTDTPILTNLTTGTSITYNGNITASQTLVVDMLNQTALLNGTSVIGKLSGDWIELAPGMNRMSYTATNEQTAPKSTLEWQEIVG